MARGPLLVLICVSAVLGVAASAHSQDLRNDYFENEFWCELDPMVPEPGQSYPLSKDAAIKQVLTEARFVFSGMVYGFEFDYAPPDSARGVVERFELTPVAQIPWGDSGLSVLGTRVERARFIATLLYVLKPIQEGWKRGWDSNLFPTVSASGQGSYNLGFAAKLDSYNDAIKQAIRDYVRARVYNRPKEITGAVVLRGTPYTVIDSGKYVTTLSMRLRIDKIIPYSVY